MIPSLLQIPSAVSDSKLHSVLPNDGKGDFTFDRSTGATRINRDGLIEEVGYFSSELVQNGNFSELGSELITNGDFSNGSTDWINTDGSATFINNYVKIQSQGSTLNRIRQIDVTQVGKTFKLSYEIIENNNVSEFKYFNGTGYVTTTSTVGTHTVYFVAGSNDDLFFNVADTNTDDYIIIDNVSVKQVDPNDRWTLSSGFSFSSNGLHCTSDGTYEYAAQNNAFVIGKSYNITFTVVNYTSGIIRVRPSGQSPIYTVSANGTYTFNYTAANTTLVIERHSACDMFVSNISVVEVQGDRPRLSYDITNGVVEDKPHLLLEPSSTNLFDFSENFSQWTNIRTTDSLSSISSPSNTTNVYKIIPTTHNNTHRIDKVITLTDTNTYSLSFFAKKGEYNCIRAAIGKTSVAGNTVSFNLNTGVKTEAGTVASSSMPLLPNGWYRCSLTTTASTADRVVIGIGNDDTYSFAGDGTSGLYLWGAMIEEKAFSTSYIKTAGTTITRAAETCNNSKPSVNSTEGVLYCEIAALSLNDDTFREITLNDGTLNNVVELRYNNVDNQIQFVVRDGGSVTVNSQVAFSDVLEYNKTAFQYKANDFKVFANGSKVATDTAGSVPSGLDQIQFDRGDGSTIFYGKVKGLAVYNEALSESQLMQLTGVTASSIYSNFVTRTASFTVEALNEVKKVIDNL